MNENSKIGYILRNTLDADFLLDGIKLEISVNIHNRKQSNKKIRDLKVCRTSNFKILDHSRLGMIFEETLETVFQNFLKITVTDICSKDIHHFERLKLF